MGELELTGRRLDDVDLTGTRLHAAFFNKTRITDAMFVDTELEGELVSLRVNGIDVGPLVEAELDRLHPERLAMRSNDPVELRDAWSMLVARWHELTEHARGLPEERTHLRVDDDWSFVETMRHLVFATDSWLGRMIRGELHPYHRLGLAGPWLTDPAALGLEVDADPTFDEVLEARRARMDDVGATLASLTGEELARRCEPPGPGHPDQPHTVAECLHVIFNEEWWHHRFATRDLQVLEAVPAEG